MNDNEELFEKITEWLFDNTTEYEIEHWGGAIEEGVKFCDFKIVEYMSVEKIISENMETFYKVWEHTMIDWNDGKNDYKEMTKFLLKVVLQTYKSFFEFMELYHSKMTKPERIEYILKDRGYVMTKRELIELCPDISDTTIEITLGELLRSGKVEKIGGGRYTKYRYKK